MLRLPTAPNELRDEPSNRLGLDFAAEAARFPSLGYGIIDIHSHINGTEASAVWAPIARAYGVEKTFSMSRLEDVPMLRERFGESIEFIAVPDWYAKDKRVGHGTDYLARIEKFRELGCRIVKFWNAPRFIDFGVEAGDKDMLALDGALRIEQMKLAERLGMICMTHVADPDTWFEAKYTDTAKYGRKLDHYTPLRKALDRFTMPWIAAHMGGFPEDLRFLDTLLEAHPNLHLDTSATKWMVRELGRQEVVDHSRHDRPREEIRSKHRKRHGQGERREEVLRRAVEKQHGDEHDRDRERGDECRARDLHRPVENRRAERLAEADVAVDVFDFDRGVVDEDAHRQRQAAERHHVQRVAEQVEHRDRA